MRSDRSVLIAAGILLSIPCPVAATGLSTVNVQMWDQGLLQVPDGAEEGDGFGWAVAAGDFNGDGYEDLALGIAYEDLPAAGGAVVGAGAVVVLYGTSSGLDLPGAQAWTRDVPGVEGAANNFDLFGFAVVSGDFNGDDYDDLAIGVPGDSLGTGAVNVLYGSSSGLAATGDQLWSQGNAGVQGGSSPFGLAESFGYSLAARDFDGDGYDDLAIGVPQDDQFLPCTLCGGVNVLFGSVVGLTADRDQYFYATDFGGSYEDSCWFGGSLAAADFDADGFDDLAVGARYDRFLGYAVGSARVLFGSAIGLSTADDIYLLGPADGSSYGAALAAGDLDGDGDDDLAIGMPGRTVGGDSAAGAVAIWLSSGRQLVDGGEWNQDTPGVAGTAEPNDGFGSALAIGDFDRDGREDLAIGVPDEGLQESGEGAVHVLFGAAGGITATGSQLWLRDDLPLVDPSASDLDDNFGYALAVGDFDGSGHADLVIGSPGEALTTAGQAGAAYVLYGSLFADGFESGSTGAWSSVVP